MHAHQAAEKLLNALLIRQGVRPPRTHRLGALLDRIDAHQEARLDLRADCALLDRLFPKSRYPEATEAAAPSIVEAQDAADSAARVRLTVMRLLSSNPT